MDSEEHPWQSPIDFIDTGEIKVIGPKEPIPDLFEDDHPETGPNALSVKRVRYEDLSLKVQMEKCKKKSKS